jgi:UDP-galactopyranose mutase
MFWSAVTRDPFPHEKLRSFAFHFKPGFSMEEKLKRMQEILKVPLEEFDDPVVGKRRIPVPAIGHDGIVSSLDSRLAEGRLALTGNYFQGLAIEDCVQRSFAEWERISAV